MKKMIMALIVLGSFAAQAADISCQYQVGNKKTGSSILKSFDLTIDKDGLTEIVSKQVKGYQIFAWCNAEMMCEFAITNHKTQVSVNLKQSVLRLDNGSPLSLNEADGIAQLTCMRNK